jgi:adsorption protein B
LCELRDPRTLRSVLEGFVHSSILNTPTLLSALSQGLGYGLALLGCIFLFGALDDLFLDIVQAVKGLKPTKVSELEWSRWRSETEGGMAIMIPAWRESSVLEAMVRTNLARLKYRNYRFFIGVYPNDVETLTIAKSLETRYPNLVTVVITDRPGPTTKAHCLNNILRVILGGVEVARKDGKGWIPRFLAIHDAEDVIHPLALTAVNAREKDVDFVQVPIFSLPVPLSKWVAGTYLDEFAEVHLKEIPVRQAVGMPVPSAGVGTFFSLRAIEQVNQKFGYVFDEKNLTEDYEISLRFSRMGARQEFLLVKDPDGNIVATREYFPDEFTRSVRQKTRWTTGIALQTWVRWGWMDLSLLKSRDLMLGYALWRDRKSLWSNPVSAAGWISSLAATALWFAGYPVGSGDSQLASMLHALLVLNGAFLLFRLVQRARFCGAIYGWKQGLLAIPRLILSTFVNALASYHAVKNYLFLAAEQGKIQADVRWDKTDHKFPTIEIEDQRDDRIAQTLIS